MEKGSGVNMDILKKNKSRIADVVYLLAAGNTWEDESKIHQEFPSVVENSSHSNPDVFMKVEECGDGDTFNITSSDTTESRYISSTDVKKEDVDSNGNAKDNECMECGKRFNQQSNLKEHMTIHTGAKDYECMECGKKFNQQSNLKKHMVIHTGAKDYECMERGKTFKRGSNLKRHLTIHTF